MGPATLTGACILSSLNLLSGHLNDVATLDCELDKLKILADNDASEWDDFATACISPASLTSTDACNRVPLFVLGDTPVHALYNANTAEDFFEAQTKLDTEHCASWFYTASGHDDYDGADGANGACGCDDRIALKTLGSNRRTAVLTMHKARTEAAESVRVRRKLAEAVLLRALQNRCADPAVDCEAVRAIYAATKASVATSEYIPPPIAGA